MTPPVEPRPLEDGYDVVVVGAGLAGVCAALTAAEDHARVLLLDKQPDPGGSTVLSSGLMAFAGTDEQAAAGIRDSEAALRHDLVATGGRANDTMLVDAYCHDQLGAYRWLKALGVQFGSVHAASGQSVPRSHATDPHDTLQRVLRAARSCGVDLRTHASVVSLRQRDERVCGVHVDERDRQVSIAAGAVVLASGGFTRNEDLLAQHAPQMHRALRGGGAGNTGDGLLMAMELGAAASDFQHVKGTFGIHPFSSDTTGILAIYKGAIAVNLHGERFVDESLPYKVVGDACLEQDEAGAYQVFDSKVMAAADRSVPIYDFRSRLERGEIIQAATIQELARAIDVPEEALAGTVDAYNAAIASGGQDAFGRRHLAGGVGDRRPIDTSPYYAFPSTTVVLATYCGVSVTPDGEVRSTQGGVIPGLYAVGEITGGFHGAGYMTGSSLGKSAVFGRRTGHAAARAALRTPA